MTTITFQTNDTYGQKLFRKLKQDRNLINVHLQESTKHQDEIELILPGSELSDSELLEMLTSASKGKSIPLSQSRNKTRDKIASWRKSK